MDLTDTDVAVLQHLERKPLQRHGATDLTHGHVLDSLEARGLVRRTATNWVLTDDGRRALVAVDGRTRMTVQTWGRNAYGAPS